MRRTYEKKSDRQKEKKVVRKVSQLWNCIPKKLPRKYEMDYALCRDRAKHAPAGEGGGSGYNWNERYKIKSFIEIKCRTIESSRYETSIIGIEKWLKGCDLSTKTSIPCYLVYKFTNGLYYFQFDPDYKTYINITMGGRKDRGDKQDHEPVVHIPKYMMNQII